MLLKSFVSAGPCRRRAFTLLEILIAIGIIGVLMAFLLPAIEKSREQAIEVKCVTNLRQIGQAIALYAGANRGAYPRTAYVPGQPLAYGTNPAAADPFLPGGPQANDVTAAMFLLVREQHMATVLFTCPYTDVNVFEEDKSPNVVGRSNFADYKKNLGYSFANPYPDAAAVDRGYKLTNHLSQAFAVAADLNPGDGKNSENHEERGQNVLFADGHVSWMKVPTCGVAGDNVYTNKNGGVNASPVDAADSILLPAQK